MAVINIPLAIYGAYEQIYLGLKYEYATPASLAENIASLQRVFVSVRSDVDTKLKNSAFDPTSKVIFTPLLAFYIFAWFGLGAEMRKAYAEALLKLGVALREHWPHVALLPSSWSAIALRKAKLQQGLANALPFVQPNTPQTTPYTSGVPPDNDPQLPASPIRIPPSNPVGNRIDAKRQGRVPPREPARRLSIHKPPLAALNPANAIPSVSDVPLRRLSRHKPPFVPLAPPAHPAIASPDASGSVPPTIPLAEIARDTTGERNAISQAESVVEGSMTPPPFSSPSTYTAPSQLATPSTATPAPPYQEANPFLECVPNVTMT
jgi:hypothetical protein